MKNYKWEKLLLTFINIWLILTVLGAVVFLGIYYYQLNDQEIYVNITSPYLEIEEQYQPQINESLQFQLKSDFKTNPELSISRAFISIPYSELPPLAFELSIILSSGVLIYCLILMKGFVQTVSDPFNSKNVNRFYTLGVILLLASVYKYVKSMVGFYWMKSQFEFLGMELVNKGKIDWSLAVAGLFLLVIAKVFSEGLKLKEEQALTI